eukprot:4940161-Pyramimonas_sp.AAC.1
MSTVGAVNRTSHCRHADQEATRPEIRPCKTCLLYPCWVSMLRPQHDITLMPKVASLRNNCAYSRAVSHNRHA